MPLKSACAWVVYPTCTFATGKRKKASVFAIIYNLVIIPVSCAAIDVKFEEARLFSH